MKSGSKPLLFVLSSQVGNAAKAMCLLCKASARLLPDHEALTTLAPRGGRNFYSKLIPRSVGVLFPTETEIGVTQLEIWAKRGLRPLPIGKALIGRGRKPRLKISRVEIQPRNS